MSAIIQMCGGKTQIAFAKSLNYNSFQKSTVENELETKDNISGKGFHQCGRNSSNLEKIPSKNLFFLGKFVEKIEKMI